MVLAAVSILLRGGPEPDRGRGPPSRSRAISAAAPGTTTSSRRCSAAAGAGVMATIGTAGPAQGGPASSSPARRGYVDDLTLPGMLWLAVVRSPYAHARINGVDVCEGACRAGRRRRVLGRRTSPTTCAAGLPCAWPVTEDIKSPTHWPLARDKARYAGDGVAVVVAETPRARQGRRGAGRGRLRAAAGGHGRRRRRSTRARRVVHDELGTNRCYTWTLVGRRGGQGVRRGRGHGRPERYRQQPADPDRDGAARSARAAGPGRASSRVWSATQIPHILARAARR